MKIIYFIIAIILISLGGAKESRAESPDKFRGFTISPLFQEIIIDKDQKDSLFTLDVTNTTDAPQVLRISVLDFGTLNETGGVAFLGSSQDFKYSLASWISLEKDAIVLNPGESQRVNGTIENKESLSPGGHYGAVFFKSEDKNISEDNASSVAFDPSFASLLFVRKIGGEIYGLNLKSQDNNAKLLKLPSKINLRFQNTGNVHVSPRGIVSLTDPLGREVRKGIINLDSSIILPEAFRVYPISIKPIANSFLPGIYTLAVYYRFDGKEEFALVKKKMLVIPPLFYFAIIIIFVLLAAAFYAWKKKILIRKKDKRD
jgi:hypothetical protein